MKRKRSVYRVCIAFLGFMTFGMLLWQVVWMVLQRRDLPIHFELSLLQDFHYVEGIPEEDREEPFSRYGYSVIGSHDTPIVREIPDTRYVKCRAPLLSGVIHELPTTSVVIAYTQVDRAVLLRNVVSILTRSAPAPVIELILVDDGSESPDDGKILSELPGVKVIRNEKRRGRGLARMQGAAVARGEVIAFVDFLAEVNDNWLTPLVLKLLQHSQSVVSPAIDLIDHVTFEYRSLPGLFRGAFDWSLQYHWEEIPARHLSYDDPSEPYRSPIISGSVFAVKKEFFDRIGGYDQSQGARETEDLEFSLRTWMCGGQIEIIPCSRVGVVQAKGKDLGKPSISFSSYMRSARRVAEIWMEEYKRFFYSTRPTARMQQTSDISSQRKLKERLKCKSFKWFITSVYPQLQPLINDEVAYGYFRQGNGCLDVDPGQLPLVAKLRECEEDKSSQEWSWRKRGVIVTNGMCLTADLMSLQGYVSVQFCKDIETQIWYRHKEKIVHQETNLCLDGQQGDTGLIITDCIKDEESQAWEVEREVEEKQSDDTYGVNEGIL